MVMGRTASTLKAKEQTAPASAAIAEIGPVYIRERSADYSRSQPQLSQKLSSDSSPRRQVSNSQELQGKIGPKANPRRHQGWILDAARLSCQDAAKEVVASSFCEVVELLSVQGVQPLWSGNCFPCSVVFSLLLLFKGPTLLVPGN